MVKQNFTEINKSLLQLVYTDGRITIPMEYRKIYGIEEGDIVELLLIGFRKNNGGGNKDGNNKNPE